MTKKLNDKVLEGLAICYKIANILKEKYPNEIMNIKDDTILPFQRKNRKCHSKNIGGYAYYSNKRIIIQQKQLADPCQYRTKYKNQKDRTLLYGNFALIELMCHELAHHITSGHAKGFKIKYNKFFSFMTNLIISGEYYKVP